MSNLLSGEFLIDSRPMWENASKAQSILYSLQSSHDGIPHLCQHIPEGCENILTIPIGDDDDTKIKQQGCCNIGIAEIQGTLIDIRLVATCLRLEAVGMETNRYSYQDVMIHQHIFDHHHSDCQKKVRVDG